MLKMYRINVFFPLNPPLSLKEYVLYTQLNMNNYHGRPLTKIWYTHTKENYMYTKCFIVSAGICQSKKTVIYWKREARIIVLAGNGNGMCYMMVMITPLIEHVEATC